MQAQNILPETLSGSLLEPLKASTSLVRHGFTNWSGACFDLLARISAAAKGIVMIAWNTLSSFFKLTKTFSVNHPHAALLVGGGMGILAFLSIYWKMREAPTAQQA